MKNCLKKIVYKFFRNSFLFQNLNHAREFYPFSPLLSPDLHFYVWLWLKTPGCRRAYSKLWFIYSCFMWIHVDNYQHTNGSTILLHRQFSTKQLKCDTFNNSHLSAHLSLFICNVDWKRATTLQLLLAILNWDECVVFCIFITKSLYTR